MASVEELYVALKKPGRSSRAQSRSIQGVVVEVLDIAGKGCFQVVECGLVYSPYPFTFLVSSLCVLPCLFVVVCSCFGF